MSQTELKPVHPSSSLPTQGESKPSEPKKRSTKNCPEVAELAISTAVNQKALDVRALDVGALCSFADTFLIVSGTSERHVKGIADKIVDTLKASGVQPLSVSGQDSAEWIVLDFDDLIVHVFYEPARQFFELDTVWEEAPLLALNKSLEEELRFLRTGSIR